MKNLSLTEEYVLCILNEKESKSILCSKEYAVCIIATSIWELISYKAVKLTNDKNLVINVNFDGTKGYLKYIYDDIKLKESIKVTELVEDYIFNGSNSNLKNIVKSLVEDLVKNNSIKIEKKEGLFKEKEVYIGNVSVINNIIKQIREDILESKNVSAETMILATMLFWSKAHKEYFSKYEAKQIKETVKKIKETEEYLFIKEILDDIQSILLTIVVSSNNMA